MTLFDLFAGAGGLALGLSKAGFERAVLVERDPYACATILKNVDRRVPNTKAWRLLERNVADVDYSTLTDEVDLLSAGLPCQPFSVAGKGGAHQDRRDMFCEVVRAARDLRPKAILIENVKGLLRPKFREYFDYLLLAIASPSLACVHREDWEPRLELLRHKLSGSAAEHQEYAVHVHGVNAADFGVPQWRERVLIVAFRNDLDVDWSSLDTTHSLDSLLWSQWKTGDYWRRHRLPSNAPLRSTRRVARRLRDLRRLEEWTRSGLLPWVTVRDAISDLPTPPRVEQESLRNHSFRGGARIYARHTGSSWDEPAKTLKAGNHGVPGGENTLLLDPDSVRYFSIRECARLQTFPDTYEFSGPWSRAMRQVGNAVPVELARIVGAHIKYQLSRAEASRQEKPTGVSRPHNVTCDPVALRLHDDGRTTDRGAAWRNEARDSGLRARS